jgi:hypothetical protein
MAELGTEAKHGAALRRHAYGYDSFVNNLHRALARSGHLDNALGASPELKAALDRIDLFSPGKEFAIPGESRAAVLASDYINNAAKEIAGLFGATSKEAIDYVKEDLSRAMATESLRSAGYSAAFEKRLKQLG